MIDLRVKPDPYIEYVRITPLLPIIAVDDELQLRAIVHYSDGTEVDSTNAAEWSSTDSNVAVVDRYGVMTGIGGGATVVVAIVGGVTGLRTAIVTGVPIPVGDEEDIWFVIL